MICALYVLDRHNVIILLLLHIELLLLLRRFLNLLHIDLGSSYPLHLCLSRLLYFHDRLHQHHLGTFAISTLNEAENLFTVSPLDSTILHIFVTHAYLGLALTLGHDDSMRVQSDLRCHCRRDPLRQLMKRRLRVIAFLNQIIQVHATRCR